ncbi:MAG TPA: hypothetical protein VFT13_09365 [Candidatus Krumholzibacteria bacterium]|nr:hypothetical protein [Candidatus Krumholzibacteria bacterium]
MKRIAILLLLLTTALFAACSGDDGAQGPVGPAGTPQPIKVLFLGAEIGGSLDKALFLNAGAEFPPGSTFSHIEVLDSIPPLSELRKYHCVIFYTNNAPADPVALGDRFADYVDDGGNMVLLQGAFSNPYAIGGRIVTGASYSPFTPADPAGDAGVKTIDTASLDFPLHKIFVGVDIPGYARPGFGTFSVPGVRPDADVLANFNGALVAVAINANKNIIAINDYPNSADQTLYPLVRNCALFLAGKI